MKLLICFDIEATGTDVAKDRIVQLAAMNSNGVKFNWLVNPQIPIPEEATAIHGITNEMVRGIPPFSRYAKDIFEVMKGCDLLGFNLTNFDVPMLWEEFYRAGYEWDLSDTRIFDAGILFKKREGRSLSDAVRFYLGREMQNAHNALSDVEATMEVFQAQLQRYNLSPFMCDRDKVAKETQYDEERVDLAGKIVMKNGVPVWNFGNCKGQRLKRRSDSLFGCSIATSPRTRSGRSETSSE